jgi:hypothetical protein
MDTVWREVHTSFTKGIMAVHPAFTSPATKPPRLFVQSPSGSRLVKHIVGPLGVHAVLYCGTCETIVAFEKAATGPVKAWPYCPIHQERPLMVRSVSP